MIKTLSFACLHFSVAFTVAYLLTGSMLVGGLIALLEPTVNTLAFYCHERVWQRVIVKDGMNTVSGNISGLRDTPRHLSFDPKKVNFNAPSW